MTHAKYRWMTVGTLAGGCAGLMGMTAMLNAGFALGENSALIMGSAFNPTPNTWYMGQITDHLLDPDKPFPGQPTFGDYTPVSVFTPESDYGTGLTQGVADLDQAITSHLANDGDNVVVFGYSMSASVATQEMLNLAKAGYDGPADPGNVQFVLFEDLNSPNGGFFTRFPSQLPVAPVDSEYHADIYNIEYSGGSDLPHYVLNPFAMANAMAGYLYLHTAYLQGWPTSFDSDSIQNAVQLPTSEGYDGNTDFYLIPTQDLPLLAGLRATPFVGNALADLIQPQLRVLVDLGYDRSDPADLTTPASFSMPTIDWDTVAKNLELGAQQGYQAFLIDLGLSHDQMPDLYPFIPDLAGQIADPSMIGL